MQEHCIRLSYILFINLHFGILFIYLNHSLCFSSISPLYIWHLSFHPYHTYTLSHYSLHPIFLSCMLHSNSSFPPHTSMSFLPCSGLRFLKHRSRLVKLCYSLIPSLHFCLNFNHSSFPQCDPKIWLPITALSHSSLLLSYSQNRRLGCLFSLFF